VHGNNTRNLPLSQTSKNPCFSYYLLFFFFYKIIEQKGRTGSVQRWREGAGGKQGAGEVAQIMYTHVSKCKNNKIKL
jgi:hypothetical protein